jgi:hypothetical protein
VFIPAFAARAAAQSRPSAPPALADSPTLNLELTFASDRSMGAGQWLMSTNVLMKSLAYLALQFSARRQLGSRNNDYSRKPRLDSERQRLVSQHEDARRGQDIRGFLRVHPADCRIYHRVDVRFPARSRTRSRLARGTDAEICFRRPESSISGGARGEGPAGALSSGSSVTTGDDWDLRRLGLRVLSRSHLTNLDRSMERQHKVRSFVARGAN